MPANKNKKAKSVKKVSPKKLPAKKLPAKKTKIAAAKKPVKKAVAKPAKKTAVKKAVKKDKKKTAAAKAVKPAKKIIKKPEPKKLPAKKAVKAAKEKKPEVKKLPAAKKEDEPKKSLASTILAKHSTKKKVEQEEEVKAEPKKELIQKGIIVRRSDGKNKITFKVGDYAVYPSHGIGKIVDIEKTNILNQEFKCYLMYFEKEKLTIKIPMHNSDKIGLRSLISKEQMDEVFAILRSGVKKLKGMWSRRAQEYETKINSGDIILLAEVLRDLTRDIEDSERSYSERIIYETAIYRLASEYAAIYGVSFEEAKDKIITIAKDKLGSESKATQKDEFDEFDMDGEGSDSDEDEENEDEEDEDDEDEDEDDDFDYDDDEDDDDAPRKKRKK